MFIDVGTFVGDERDGVSENGCLPFTYDGVNF